MINRYLLIGVDVLSGEGVTLEVLRTMSEPLQEPPENAARGFMRLFQVRLPDRDGKGFQVHVQASGEHEVPQPALKVRHWESVTGPREDL